MEWAATTEDFIYVSQSADTSKSDFAEMGQMRNGSFFADE
jgi:hypothetical protein